MKAISWRFAISASIGFFVLGCATKSSPQGTSSMIEQDIAAKPTEGMWLPDALPTEQLKQLGFSPTQQWMDHLRLSSVKIDGGSGSFISSDGLVLTNHHVAAEGLANISSAGKDYMATGFYARSLEEEIPLPGFEVKVLVSMDDVTHRVNSAVDAKLSPEAAVKARHAVMANISRESEKATGLQSDVITLFGGARYQLYRSKRYADVRAVFAPEFAAAFFGGDPDNFEYPRYDLDISIVRVYENGKPAHIEHFLKISPDGVKDGDLVFVTGHPGSTHRLLPASALQARRFSGPIYIDWMQRFEKALLDYGARGEEQRRQAQDDLFGMQNSLKATRPELAALRGGMVERKQQEEASLRQSLRARPDLRGYDAAWDRAREASQQNEKLFVPLATLEWADGFASSLFHAARTLVRLPAEDAKPDEQRLAEFTQSRRAMLEHRLFAEEPTYPELEIAKLTMSLKFLQDYMKDDPIVAQVMAGKSPADRARELVTNSKLSDVAERKRLKDGGAAAIAASQDPMIQLAVLADPQSRQVRSEYEAKAEEPLTQAMTDINRARFALLGNRIYPDATFTLRLAFGVVKGYEQDGQPIPPLTTVGGAFDHEQRHGGQPPYQLPQTWHQPRSQLSLKTPLNFVSTADITGGNSGSPVVNRNGELVGVIFDSNRQGITNKLAFTDIQARAVSVDSRGILEALKKVYGAQRVLDSVGR